MSFPRALIFSLLDGFRIFVLICWLRTPCMNVLMYKQKLQHLLQLIESSGINSTILHQSKQSQACPDSRLGRVKMSEMF